MADKNSMFRAILKSENEIEVFISKEYNWKGCQKLFLVSDDGLFEELKIDSKNESSKGFFYRISEFPKFKLGVNYQIFDERNIAIELDLSYLLRLDKYVGRLKYDGELGAIYQKERTTFRVFAPLATSCAVVITTAHNGKIAHIMDRDDEHGIYETVVEGDLDKAEYFYLVKVNGNYVEAVDPYARAVTLFSKRGVVVNPEKVYVDLHNDKLKPLSSITDAIIYETSIRDITSDKNTSIKEKGKYLGLTEEGVTTPKGLPVGIDYIKSLGITHVQLLPVFDFCTTNDLNPKDSYNWGYDPLNFNAPEGSYSSHPEDPYARIKELKSVIGKLHENGIRAVMDVVYNHVFNLEGSNFHAICPSYYFRYHEDGTKSDGSFCGSEFESRHLMARKFIVDSCVYWVKEFGFDGFRFDLMGLIDNETLNLVYEECRKINPCFICYGEGWDMPSVMPSNQKGSMNNAHLMPNIGFFNDRFRDITKGKTSESELYVRGYLTGDINYIDGFKHTFTGCTVPIAFPPLFTSVSQSINYVECHDNNTLMDKIRVSCYDEDINSHLKRLKLINAYTVLCYGVPFIHMGQEIGLSKNGQGNTYNAGDELNHFDYAILDERENLYRFFKDVVSLKKDYSFFRLSDKDIIKQYVYFANEYNGCLRIEINKRELIAPYSDVRIYINPTRNAISVDLDDYYQIIFNEAGRIVNPLYSQHLAINGLTLVVCVKQ